MYNNIPNLLRRILKREKLGLSQFRIYLIYAVLLFWIWLFIRIILNYNMLFVAIVTMIFFYYKWGLINKVLEVPPLFWWSVSPSLLTISFLDFLISIVYDTISVVIPFYNIYNNLSHNFHLWYHCTILIIIIFLSLLKKKKDNDLFT